MTETWVYGVSAPSSKHEPSTSPAASYMCPWAYNTWNRPGPSERTLGK